MPSAESLLSRMRSASLRGVELQDMFTLTAASTPLVNPRRDSSPMLYNEDEDQVLTDPCACTSRDFLCGNSSAPPPPPAL